MKIRTALLLIPVLLALCAGTAAAKTAPKQQAKLDPSFGRGGVAKTATAAAQVPGTVKLAVSSAGKSYVLQNATVLAFGSNGKPDPGFGKNGRVTITTTKGEAAGKAIAVDSQGRILITGALPPPSAYSPETFVIRLLPNGTRDPQFGSNGEVDTTFGVPAPQVPPLVEYLNGHLNVSPIAGPVSLTVDAQDRPIVGGYTSSLVQSCYLGTHPIRAPLVARLTASGAIDPSFGGGHGYVIGNEGAIVAMGFAPSDELVTLDNRRLECGEHEAEYRTMTGRLTEAGDTSPLLDPGRPELTVFPQLAVDPSGRSLVLETSEAWAEDEGPNVLTRLLPSGAVDTSFGHEGGMPVSGRFANGTWFAGIGVDAKGRPLVAAGAKGVEVLRLQTDGKADPKFGPKGVVRGGAKGNTEGRPEAIALDGRGRIYVAGWVVDPALKTGDGVQVTRILPGS